MAEKYKYNNKDLVKIKIIEAIKKIQQKNNDISKISINHLYSTQYQNKNCLHSSHKPIISITIGNLYSLSFCQEDEHFHYKKIDLNNPCCSSMLLSNNSQIPIENKFFYINKTRINCQRFLKIFKRISENLNHTEHFICENNQSFIFNLNCLTTFEKDMDNFLGMDLCCTIFHNELVQSIPDTLFKQNQIVKF